jgi:hypothetical protein
MIRDPAKLAYRDQKQAARKRGIPFLLSFEEWDTWWREQAGANYLQKRGCFRGQLVMARLGDEGPYSLSNIKCITCEQNSSEIKSNPSIKIPDDKVLEIFYAVGSTREIGRRYGVHGATVWSIKAGRYRKSTLIRGGALG